MSRPFLLASLAAGCQTKPMPGGCAHQLGPVLFRQVVPIDGRPFGVPMANCLHCGSTLAAGPLEPIERPGGET